MELLHFFENVDVFVRAFFDADNVNEMTEHAVGRSFLDLSFLEYWSVLINLLIVESEIIDLDQYTLAVEFSKMVKNITKLKVTIVERKW